MKPACRLHPIALAILLGALVPARAQVAPSPPSPPAAPTGGYVDKVIEGLEPEEQAEAQAYPYDQTGWPRFLKLEARLGTEPFDDQRSARLGYSVYGVLETPNHGTLSIDAQYAPDDSDGTLTLRQTNMPLGGGWLANHSLG